MNYDHIMSEINKDFEWEHITRVKGYGKNYGILDKSGVVQRLLTESELEEYYDELNILTLGE